jgi:hypothetical protein
MDTERLLENIYSQCYFMQSTECILWQGKTYIEPLLNGRSVRALVWSVENGDIPGDYRVVQTCGSKDCIRIEHLNLEPLPQRVVHTKNGTTYTIPTARRGRRPDLTVVEAKTIRQLRMDGVQRKTVAQRFSTSEEAIWYIEAGKSHNQQGTKPEGWYPGCTIKKRQVEQDRER